MSLAGVQQSMRTKMTYSTVCLREIIVDEGWKLCMCERKDVLATDY